MVKDGKDSHGFQATKVQKIRLNVSRLANRELPPSKSLSGYF